MKNTSWIRFESLVGHTQAIIFIFFLLCPPYCSQSLPKEDHQNLSEFSYPESVLDFPTVFSPIQLFGINHPRDYFQIIRVDDEKTLWKVWEFNLMENNKTFTRISQIDGTCKIGVSDPEIRDELFWFLPEDWFFNDPKMVISFSQDSNTPTQTNTPTQITEMTHALPDGCIAHRWHVHASNPTYSRFINQHDDIKELGKNILMMDVVFLGAETTQEGFRAYLNEEPVPIRRMMALKFSLEFKGVLWGGFVQGEYIIQKEGTTQNEGMDIVQFWNHRKKRLFQWKPTPENSVITLESNHLPYYMERQFFIKKNNHYFFKGSEIEVAPEEKVELMVVPPIQVSFPTAFRPLEKTQHTWRIRLASTSHEIQGIMEQEIQATSMTLDIHPTSPDWCAERPLKSTYSLLNDGSIEVNTQIVPTDP